MTETVTIASIIIPNYNHARFVGDAILSVLRQTRADYEVIVVDDGSTDNSREVIGRFEDRVRAIYQPNQGLSSARNTGIQAARGAYIGVLDADDMYEPDFLETLVPLLEGQPEAGGAYCGYRFVDEGNRPLPQVEAREVPPESLFQALVDGNFLVPESMFIRRSCYEQVGLFDTSLTALEDLDMWLRITSRFRVISTTRLLTRHRVLAGSMSSDPDRQNRNRMKVMQKHFGAQPLDGEAWTEAARRAYGRAYLMSAVEFLQSGNEERAADCLREMVTAWPELLNRMETFYELGCGSQPKGYRGQLDSLNLNQNLTVVMRLLGKLVGLPGYEARKRTALANVHYAFGMFSYGQGNTRAARSHFLEAVRAQPGLLADRTYVGFAARSLLGVAMVRRLKALAGRPI